MESTSRPSPGIVVGIDGSRWALNAALWAVDEALSRNVPLRLIYVVQPRNRDEFDGQEASRDLARADIAIRQARIALESTEKPVSIEWAVVHGEPADVLLHASESADMLCVGSFGVTHAVGDQRAGSTATALSAAAGCPVAVIGRDSGPYTPTGRIVVAVDGTADSAHVLTVAGDEAELRGAQLTIVDASQPGCTAAADGDDHGGDPVQLLIIGQQGNQTHDVTCPVLICPQPRPVAVTRARKVHCNGEGIPCR
ncbi:MULTISPECIES: universal stress protein [unclassified Mycolicibacterium]|uniref:universal stress protein n=1 Tax=unclassified Mycolicibacterium TaxID=2636767 RepID=UPI002EDB7E02